MVLRWNDVELGQYNQYSNVDASSNQLDFQATLSRLTLVGCERWLHLRGAIAIVVSLVDVQAAPTVYCSYQEMRGSGLLACTWLVKVMLGYRGCSLVNKTAKVVRLSVEQREEMSTFSLGPSKLIIRRNGSGLVFPRWKDGNMPE